MKLLQWINVSRIILLLIACSPGFPGQHSCNELPSIEAIRRALEQHAGTRTQIEQLNPNAIVFAIEESQRCPGNGTLIIYHATAAEAKQIRRLLGETLFGIPYRLRNV